jgi:hypothetical protein
MWQRLDQRHRRRPASVRSPRDADDVDSDDNPATLTYAITSTPPEGSMIIHGAGGLDASFGADGLVITPVSATDHDAALGVQADGKIVWPDGPTRVGRAIAWISPRPITTPTAA